MKYTYITFIFLFFLGCGKQTEESASVVQSSETALVQEDELEISEADFLKQGLRLVNPSSFNFGKFIRTNGYIDVPPEGRASVSAFYGGYIKEIGLIPGQEVKKGEVLLTLENPEYLELQQNYLSILRQMDYLKDDYERQKTLLKENNSSRKSILKMLGINTSEVEKGNFSSKVYLRSPISGSITEVHAVRGQYLPPAEPAVGIINKDHIHLELQVFEKDLPMVRKDQRIRMRLPSSEEGDTYDARVYLVGNNISGENRVALVHGHLLDEKDEARFTPGMYIEADILLEEDLNSALPSVCVHADGNNDYVWVTTSKGWPKKFERKSVETGRTSAGYTEILSELPSDNQILEGID